MVGGEHKKYLDPAVANAFALEHAKGIYENQRKDREDMRVLNLTRSGYAPDRNMQPCCGPGIPVLTGKI